VDLGQLVAFERSHRELADADALAVDGIHQEGGDPLVLLGAIEGGDDEEEPRVRGV
jgi:hypothetical protein